MSHRRLVLRGLGLYQGLRSHQKELPKAQLYSRTPGRVHCSFPTGALPRLLTASLSTMYLQHPPVCRDIQSQGQAACTRGRAPCRTLFCFGPHSNLVAFQVTQQMGQRSIPKCAVIYLKNPKSLPRSTVSLS